MTNRFFIVNTVTGAATVSAPTREVAEAKLRYSDKFIPKKGVEWAICEFSPALGITLLNFHQFPKSMIWDGVALYARNKENQNVTA